jgi:hypothetical protein
LKYQAILVATVLINPSAKTHATEPPNGGESSLNCTEEAVENKYFTAFDGTKYITKSHIENVILKALEGEFPSRCVYSVQRFAEKIIKELDDCYYREQIPDIKNPDVDYFYCGSCRRGFPVRYTAEMVRWDTRPCPTCGAQSNVTPKLGQEENDEKDNIEGERS